MLKKILASLMVGGTLAFVAPAAMNLSVPMVSVAHAEDYYVGAEDPRGYEIYAQSETVQVGGKGRAWRVSVKYVDSDGQLCGRDTFEYNRDEGYLWCKTSSGQTLPIAKGKYVAGDDPSFSRPHLIAIYRWLIVNYGKGNVSSSSAYDWN